MIEKVNPEHPDKIADRVAGAIVDYAYSVSSRPRIAVEVLIGHGRVDIIAETSVNIPDDAVQRIVARIAGNLDVEYREVPQDPELANNQSSSVKAGDNGIFRGLPTGHEVRELSAISRDIFKHFPTDGKYILDGSRLIVCQSHATEPILSKYLEKYSAYDVTSNPLGYWTGGINVDTGATNRKLGSDMGEAVTGGGLHGKDLSKADVAVNIYAHLKAKQTRREVSLSCAIGDSEIDGVPYEDIVKIAGGYIEYVGGFEEFARWGLV